MEDRGGKISGFAILLGVLFVFAIVHTSLHFHSYGVKSISGFSFIGETSTGSSTPGTRTSAISIIFVIAEWAILIIIMVAGRISRKRHSSAEIKKIIAEKKNASSSAKTDIDVLYEILKHQKKLGISEIASAFGITKDIAAEWAQMLEENNLAEIEYSNIGEPVIKVK
jgi:hypothetical protein